MKRLSVLILSLALLLSLCACENTDGTSTVSGQSSPAQTLRLKIGRMEDGWLWLTCEEQGLAGMYSFAYAPETVKDGVELLPGMVVDVGYDGTVMETSPMQITPLSISAAGQEDDFIGLYLEALETLYAEDPGLNSDTQYFGFDFTEVHNLSEQEKALLGWLFASDHEKEPLFGTMDELAEQGYIDLEKVYWEDGLQFILSDESAKQNGFDFSMEKWRSGLGAYRLPECRASRGNSGWTFDRGNVVGIS